MARNAMSSLSFQLEIVSTLKRVTAASSLSSRKVRQNAELTNVSLLSFICMARVWFGYGMLRRTNVQFWTLQGLEAPACSHEACQGHCALHMIGMHSITSMSCACPTG